MDSTHAHRIYWPSTKRISIERNIKFISPTVTLRSPLPSYVSTIVRSTVPMAPAPIQPPQLQAPLAPPPVPATAGPSSIFPPTIPPAPADSPLMPPSPLTPITVTPSGQMRESETPSAPSRPTLTQELSWLEIQPWRTGCMLSLSDYARQLECGEGTTGEEYSDCVFTAGFDDIIGVAILNAEADPKTLAEAQSRSNWPCWKEAMDHELATLERVGTWMDVPCPSDKNIVRSKWVFRIKRKANSSVDKYKARLVAQGFTQIYGVDYFTTFSPIAKLTSFRIILAATACFDWDIESFDFNGAYLNGELDDNEEIYMYSPPGYKGDRQTVKRLQKSLYRLKQAGWKWYDTLSRALSNLGFSVSQADPGVFTTHINDDLLILAVHIDDCVFTGSSRELIAEYKHKINTCYALTDLGPIHWLLGLKVTRDRAAHTISLSQTSYIDSILARFALVDAKPRKSPMAPGAMYSKDQAPSSPDEVMRMQKVPYHEAIGSLMYCAVATHTDIAFMVSTLLQFLDNLGVVHWEAVKYISHYLAGTKTTELTYSGKWHGLLGYADVDGGAQEHRHAILGYVFLIDGGAISGHSKKQELISMSMAEAEYIAATHAVKEAIWL